jgi:hypothetical protein
MGNFLYKRVCGHCKATPKQTKSIKNIATCFDVLATDICNMIN